MKPQKKLEKWTTDKSSITIATDGSYENGLGGSAILSSEGEWVIARTYSPTCSFDCEIQAIYMGTVVAQEYPKIHIITDSLSSIKIINSKRKSHNPFINFIRKQRKKISFTFVKSHQNLNKLSGRDLEIAFLNGQVDEKADQAKHATITVTPPQNETQIRVKWRNKEIFDRIDDGIYSNRYSKEITTSHNYSPLYYRNRCLKPSKEASKNTTNICTRASLNSLPTHDKWNSKEEQCPLHAHEDDQKETVWHAIFGCTGTEDSRLKLWNELITSISQTTRVNKREISNIISHQFMELRDQKTSLIYSGIFPKSTYKKLRIQGDKIPHLQNATTKFIYKMWIIRCNKYHESQ